jgi:small neutral amino acid transporter SnatA (MarC family)
VSESYLWYYFPLVIAIMAVLEICRHDDPKVIVKRCLINAGILTLVLLSGAIVLHVFGEFL